MSCHCAHVLLKMRKQPKLKPIEHPEPTTRQKNTTEQNQTREGQSIEHTFLSIKNNWEQIDNIDLRKGECSLKVVAERDGETKQRVLAYAAATEEESIDEMVRRLERELDEEFKYFERTNVLCPRTAAAATSDAVGETAEVPATRVPKAATELEHLEIENKIFHRSFVEVAEESATKVEEAEAARTRVPALEQMLPSEPPATNNNWKMEEATEQQSNGGSGKQKPPEMECHRRPPRARDKNHVCQVQGCRRHLSVSGKGVLDIGYLASGRGPECRSRYRFGAEARVQEVPTRLARNWQQ